MFSVVVGILGLETGVFLSLLMFVVFMALSVVGSNVSVRSPMKANANAVAANENATLYPLRI
ncbi:MAG: hypothetical protein AAGF91_09240, partial [Actinomycetota bacterium]